MPAKSTPERPGSEKGEAGRVRRFRRQLLQWYAKSARDLPWRRTRDPYRVLVSEVMLQQTQVSRVAQYYPRFLEEFPDLQTLAAAPPRAVREAWDGLGYYARAKNLHALAKGVARRGDATLRALPDEPAELMKLPGIGRYTAGAIACFAYEKPVPAVDTNVARVIRRVFYGDTAVTHRGIWDKAAELVPPDGKRAWKFNQAIMELGAVLCRARTPDCEQCPVRRECRTVSTCQASPQKARSTPMIRRRSPR